MRVRSKTLLITVGAMTILVLVFLWASSIVLVDSFVGMEQTNTRLAVQKVMDQLVTEEQMLLASATVYAHWNETYDFAQGNNSEYSRLGLPDSTFINLGVNVIVILNSTGSVIYKLGYDRDKGEMPVLPSFLEYVGPNTTINDHDYSGEGGLTGIVLYMNSPYEIVSNQILHNDKSGPPVGIFVMARQLGSNITAQTLAELGASAFIYAAGDDRLTGDLTPEAWTDLSRAGFAIVTQGGTRILGYGVVNGIDGSPIALVQVAMPRSIFQQAQSSETNLLIVLGVSGCGLTLLMVYTLEVSVIMRVERLDKAVKRIGRGGDPDQRVPLRADDEFGDLADSINEMLGTIQASKRKVMEGERRYRTVVEDQSELIARTTPQCQVTLANGAFLRFLGLKPGEENGLTFAPAGTEEQRRVLSAKVAGLSPENQVAEYEQETVVEEQKRWVQWTVRGVFDDASELAELQWVGRDVTERMRFLERLNETERIESLGVLAGGIAHDFNNMLTSISGTLAILKRESGSDPRRKRIEDAERSVLKASELTKQLLTFSKGGEPIARPIDARSVVMDASEFAAHGSDVVLEWDFDPNLKKAQADEGQLFQVISNLIINARQAMPRGGTISIRGGNHRQDQSDPLPLAVGDYVMIAVADEGVGIPKEMLSRIFDPYFTTKSTGTGLGLTIVHSIVKRHGGFIDVESEVGKGTVFTIYLPAAKGGDQGPQEAPLPPTPQEGRLLLIDDEEQILEVSGELLRGYGYDVDVATTGEQGLAMFETALKAGKPYGLVIMDLTIRGGMGGKETNHILKRNHPWASTVVSSGYSNDPVMANFRSYEFDGVVEKPYSIERMVRTIEGILKGPPHAPAPEGDEGRLAMPASEELRGH